ncbi:SRPBCC family protein [Gordonia sp. HNM0687]|uniref:SRPBCC family protein n=1 Tax=Gordonia mangrovi TaxID=2665643 RepID=A0A6L7GS08_9ACTN|nr:SRPBCC family protein [Gordonia mangrovi]MDY6811406.1 SRPBCC family protein [Actinomycetota bacterium]MXP22749.1 SRPBCC family protein [Gordonia mangrovi]UVF77064.1 SRPBCC family protein [Gordonia mangrovi]
MGTVRHSSSLEVPRHRVFAYINDHQNVPNFFFGVSSFVPVTAATEGLGSQFAVTMKVGPKTLRSTVETVDWVENELIRLESVEGFSAHTTWNFIDVGVGTQVDVEFVYTLPGGLAGRALGTVVEPFAGQAVRQTDKNLVEQVSRLA